MGHGVRVREVVRNQMELRAFDLDSALPEDHPARMVWGYVERLDTAPLYASIRSLEDGPGRAAIDPKVLLALWLFATVEGIGSARRLASLCEWHLAYQWLCGGAPVNHHTLSDFRSTQWAGLDGLLTQSVAVLMEQDLVSLTTVAQDGMRVRASAGASSYRRKKTLETCYAEAKAQVAALKAETASELSEASKAERAARERASRERVERLERALARCDALQEQARKDKNRRDPEAVRASTTDPEVSVMKMPDGGYRPAANIQFASTPDTQIIVGVDAVNVSDGGQAPPMYAQIHERYGVKPERYLMDGGFATRDSITAISALSDRRCAVYAPVRKPTNPERYSAFDRRPGDSYAVAVWRARMGTEEGQAQYKVRSQCECVNAHVKNRGLHRLVVRGLEKIRAVALLHALTHNMTRSWKLAPEWI